MVYSTRALALSAAGLAALVVGTIGIAHARPAVADTPPAVYGLDPATAPRDEIVELASAQKQHVTVRFNNAPIQRVLDWLGKQDANFVVSSSSVPSDLKISLNVKDEPLSAVENAIAAAMGGTWSKRDGIMVFHKGGAMPFEFGKEMNLFDGKDLKDLPGGFKVFTSPNGKSFKGFENMKDLPDGFKIFTGPDGKSFEFQMKGLKDSFGPEFEKKMHDQFGPDFQKKMQDNFGPEFQKKMQDQFGPEFQKKMKELDLKKGDRVFMLNNQNLTGLMESLTPDQKATMKKRGYLTPKDLNAKQLKMLGDMKGKFEVKVNNDKDSMTIKSE